MEYTRSHKFKIFDGLIFPFSFWEYVKEDFTNLSTTVGYFLCICANLEAFPDILKMLFFFTAGGSTNMAPKINSAPPDKNLSPIKVNLMQFRNNVSDLKIQLHQMRQLQARTQSSFNRFVSFWLDFRLVCTHRSIHAS